MRLCEKTRKATENAAALHPSNDYICRNRRNPRLRGCHGKISRKPFLFSHLVHGNTFLTLFALTANRPNFWMSKIV